MTNISSTLPRTAVVIPVYNDATFLRSCLDSLSRQTVMPDAVIVVDNNCTDDSVAVAESYNFASVIQESTQGICAATKAGYDRATEDCDIILRCDADSRPRPDWIEEVVAAFLAKPDIIALSGPGEFYDMTHLQRRLASLLYMQTYFWSVGAALGQKPIFGSNCAFRASVWKQISASTHLDRQDLHDDIDLSYHLATRGIILHKKDLSMPISGRPFSSFRSLLRRYPIGLRSIFIHWPEQAPWRRYVKKSSTKN